LINFLLPSEFPHIIEYQKGEIFRFASLGIDVNSVIWIYKPTMPTY
jgi:hypothetical protein